MKKDKCGIYRITNDLNGKHYIGLSKHIFRRWKEHSYLIPKSDKPLYRAIRKYGIENFSFHIVEECPAYKLSEREIYWTDKYKSFTDGYNVTSGGYTPNNVSPEVQQKIKMINVGRVMKEETKRKISLAQKGIPRLTDNQKQALKKSISKKVICVETGMIFQSITEAANYVGVKHQSIHKALNKSAHNTSCGFHWKYL